MLSLQVMSGVIETAIVFKQSRNKALPKINESELLLLKLPSSPRYLVWNTAKRAVLL